MKGSGKVQLASEIKFFRNKQHNIEVGCNFKRHNLTTKRTRKEIYENIYEDKYLKDDGECIVKYRVKKQINFKTYGKSFWNLSDAIKFKNNLIKLYGSN